MTEGLPYFLHGTRHDCIIPHAVAVDKVIEGALWKHLIVQDGFEAADKYANAHIQFRLSMQQGV